MLPSISVILLPFASDIKIGLQCTLLNARTGEFTPPGITFLAFSNAFIDFFRFIFFI